MTNELSVYDLKKHVKYVFRPGSVVKAKPTQDDKMGKVIDSCPEVSRFCLLRLELYFFFSRVTSLCSGWVVQKKTAGPTTSN
jgi:hypothetical protein